MNEYDKQYLHYDTEKWALDYFNSDNGGYLVIDRERITQGNVNKQERGKYEKEYSMCRTLAQNGYKVEYLKEIEGKYDIRLNGIPADLKKTKSHNHIVDYAKKAIRKQGADIVVFEFEKETKRIQEELDKLKRDRIKVYYYFIVDKSKIHVL
ncbi:MAG: hypothetical protein LBM08_02410 [Dysgonamonadaceae bacterium]|jgi:hypothetical protein|nr:hypothetical protein [Dysgonamonadaceae bacterium]